MSKQAIAIETPDGVARAGLFAPDGSKDAALPGAILYMDAFGPRPALDEMAERLAAAGYRVLVPDLYYRAGDHGSFDARTAFTQDDTRQRLRGLMAATTQAMTERDGAAFLDALAKAGSPGKCGAVGYCMGGARALIAAAAYPDRIAAAASFHGGNLASDSPESPHLRASSMAGRVHVGCAGIDQSFPPEQSARLAQALREAEVDYTLENYVGMAHGWAVPDHNVYDPAGAKRHWKRLLDLFGETLG